MKVKIVKAECPTYWYSNHIGEIFEVVAFVGGRFDYKVVNDNNRTGHCISKSDCEVVTNLQAELELVKTRVAEIEKQLAEEAAIEAAKPFTKEQYEKVVAEYRACAGRKKFVHCDTSFVLDISGLDVVGYDSWRGTKSVAPFGVVFDSHASIKAAIEKVGADNLCKAWSYEMNIGLSDD